MSECVERQLKELRHSEGDVVEALREQTWVDKWQKRIFQEYLTGTDESRGALMREMIDEELERVAREVMCEEV